MIKFLLLLIIASCSMAPIPSILAPNYAIEVTRPVRVVFTCKSSLPWLVDLTRIANCLANNQDFINEVKTYPKFTHTDKTSTDVANSLESMQGYVISTYKTKSPFSSVIATTYKNDKKTLYLNLRKNPRRLEDMVNTVLHESLHLAGYSHGDNSPKGKEESVNYKVGSLVEKYVGVCK